MQPGEIRELITFRWPIAHGRALVELTKYEMLPGGKLRKLSTRYVEDLWPS